jgi:hypothetical protein
LTSFLNLSIAEIFNNEVHRKMLLELIGEIKLIAVAKNISVPENIVEITLKKWRNYLLKPLHLCTSIFKKVIKPNIIRLQNISLFLGMS